MIGRPLDYAAMLTRMMRLKMRVVWIALSLFALLAAGISPASGAWMLQTSGVAATSPCANLPHSDHPKVTLIDGKMEAVVFLPDKNNGYYRSTRFDWSGVVGCVALNGHRFFGEWFENYDPLKDDAIVGPVEEFRTDAGVMGHYPPRSPLLTIQAEAIGYDDEKPGDAFLKPGVGMLQRVSDKPYSFGTLYPILNGGTWSIPRQTGKSITFQQVLNGSDGYAYVYTKTLSLDGPSSGLTLEHTLKNTGTRAIDTKVYDHDFFVFDGQPAGPGMVVRFKFEPKPVDPLGDTVRIEGKEIAFLSLSGDRLSLAISRDIRRAPATMTLQLRTRSGRWAWNKRRTRRSRVFISGRTVVQFARRPTFMCRRSQAILRIGRFTTAFSLHRKGYENWGTRMGCNR